MAQELRLDSLDSLGHDVGAGNLLGVQPYLVAGDYASPQHLFTKLSGYLAAAQRRGWLDERTVVVFPEYIGTWLVAAGQGRRVIHAPTFASGMRWLVLRRPLAFVREMVKAQEADRVAAALFRMRAQALSADYQQVFAELARSHAVTVVAGSVVLPNPRVRNGRIGVDAGPLYNVCAVFRSDGSVYPQLVHKVYPIDTELPFITAGCEGGNPLFDTPAGRLGVLICADSWYATPYESFAAGGVDLIAVPSLLAGNVRWSDPWQGYSGGPTPDDVAEADVNRLSEGEAWRRYALAGRIGQTGACCGVNVFLRGELWDLGARSGYSRAVLGWRSAPDGLDVVETKSNGGALLNVWLQQER